MASGEVSLVPSVVAGPSAAPSGPIDCTTPSPGPNPVPPIQPTTKSPPGAAAAASATTFGPESWAKVWGGPVGLPFASKGRATSWIGPPAPAPSDHTIIRPPGDV